MKRLVFFYERQSFGAKLFLSAILPATLFYFSAFLGAWIGKLLETTDWKQALLLHAGVYLVIAVTFVSLARAFAAARESIHRELERDRDMMANAHNLCDRVLSEQFDEINAEMLHPSKFVASAVCSVRMIQRLVDAAYATFETAYGQAARIDERIDFEVTFMTRSYLDALITIPAAANRENRQPRSMVLRQSRPDIYRDTETARIYGADRPTIRIVEDTKTTPAYVNLYDGETDRIRSSIIYPVLSNHNEVLGTLVVHCDKAKFFLKGREKYWTNLLEVFAKRIAFQKIKLDLLTAVGGELTISFPVAKPF